MSTSFCGNPGRRCGLLRSAATSLLIAVATGSTGASAADGYDLLGQWVIPIAVSSDGSVIVGSYFPYSVGRAFALKSGAITDLGLLPGGNFSGAAAVNADGTVVVGYADGGGGVYHAIRWTSAGMQDIGSLGGGFSNATGVSADGSVIVGYSVNADPHTHAFRWTGGGMVDLGTLGGDNSYARGVSADGSTVVGYSDIAGNAWEHAFRWTASGIVDLGTLGGSFSRAFAVNSDGSVVVGEAVTTAGTSHAFRWTSDGMVDLGVLSGANHSIARAVSADGSVVVGASSDFVGNKAFRWTQATGMISVEDWLRSNGVTVATDFALIANAVSADGNIIVGQTDSSSGFVARVTPTGPSGIIDISEYATSLATKPGVNIALNLAGTAMNGAHGEPMRNLLDVGMQSVSVTADGGYANGNGSGDGRFGVLDFAYGVGLEGGITARLTAGGLTTRQDIDTGGDFDLKGFYVAPELTIPVAGRLHATVGGYFSPSRVDVTRGYLNGGLPDFSRGESDVDTWAAKVRLDWLNAVEIGDWGFTPYGSINYARAKMDAYSEAGGAFPSLFDSVSDHATVARVGLDAVGEIQPGVRALAKLESAYRFEGRTVGTSGEIIGIAPFNFDGPEIKQLWLRGGLGTEFDTASGVVSVSLNVSTEGDDPSVWVKSGWRVTF